MPRGDRAGPTCRLLPAISAGLALAVGALAPGQADAFGAPTVLYSFCMESACADGDQPQAGLIADPQGDLFGTTTYGGADNLGMVFEIAKTAGGYADTPTTLVSFDGTNGEHPLAGLLADSNGDLFGTTVTTSTNNGGTLFEIVNEAGSYASTPTILYTFCAKPDCADGALASAGLVADAKGDLFGTTKGGGAGTEGTAFELAKTGEGYASAPTILYSFCSQSDCKIGYQPVAGLIIDRHGDLFGTTSTGMANDGAEFEIKKTRRGYAKKPKMLAELGPSYAGLVADRHGNLFGTTRSGGANNLGTVFEIRKTGHGFARVPTILISFDKTDGAGPLAGLILDAQGNLFGTTAFNGANGIGGTVFELEKTADGYASAPTTLYNFCSQSECIDGQQPVAGLVADAHGNLFGTTQYGGANGEGTVFEIPAD